MRRKDDPEFAIDKDGNWMCKHGVSSDIHCCNCHSGFLFFPDNCVCGKDEGRPVWGILILTVAVWVGVVTVVELGNLILRLIKWVR